MQRRPNVFDVVPALHVCYTNVKMCLLGRLLDYLYVFSRGHTIQGYFITKLKVKLMAY